MQLFLSIIIYSLFAFALYSLGQNESAMAIDRYHLTRVHSPKWTYNTYILLGIFILLSAIRYRVGVDCEAYVMGYEKWGKSESFYTRLEPGYVVVVEFLKSIGAGRLTYLGIMAALEIIPFYYALKSRRFLYPYLGLLIVTGPFYLIWMNGIRQSIAACIFVLASVFLVEGKHLKSNVIPGLLIVFAAQFHVTAYLLLFFLVIPQQDFFKNRYINIAIVILCAIVGQFSWVATDLLSNFSGVDIEGDDYIYHYIRDYDRLLEEESYMGFGPRRILILLWSILTLWYAPMIKERIGDKFFTYSFNLFFIHVCLCENLFSNVALHFRRPFYYTYPFELICFAYLLFYLKNYNKARNHKTVYICILGMFLLYFIIQCLADAGLPNEATLYKFIFMQ